jgi:hypothetical protein
MLTILDPVAAARELSDRSMLALPTLEGLTVGILTNHWKSMDRMAERMALRLKDIYHAAAVLIYDIPINGAMADAVKQRVIGECDAAIVGLAN